MNFITILGLVAATCTTIAFLPQAIKAIRTRHTKDLSLGMYALLTTGIVLWLIYGVFKNDLPIILANGVTLVFAVTILFLKIKYK
ncbi:MAG: SemiSWEET transporter [Bacteroidales bacterium]|nr:SemiSWEET transporter [Bacteroidales bacterium]